MSYPAGASFAVPFSVSGALTTSSVAPGANLYFIAPYAAELLGIQAYAATAPTGTTALTLELTQNGTAVAGTTVTFAASSHTASLGVANPAPSGGWSAYNASTAYTVGQSVSYLGNVYTCIQGGTGQTPSTSAAYWTLTVPGYDSNVGGNQGVAGTPGAGVTVPYPGVDIIAPSVPNATPLLTVAQGDYLQVTVPSVGSTTAGSNLSGVLYFVQK